MILLFGTKTFRWGQTYTDYVRSCPRCGFFGHLKRQKRLRTMALFFLVPILPLGGVSTVDACPQCDLVLSVG